MKKSLAARRAAALLGSLLWSVPALSAIDLAGEWECTVTVIPPEPMSARYQLQIDGAGTRFSRDISVIFTIDEDDGVVGELRIQDNGVVNQGESYMTFIPEKTDVSIAQGQEYLAGDMVDELKGHLEKPDTMKVTEGGASSFSLVSEEDGSTEETRCLRVGGGQKAAAR